MKITLTSGKGEGSTILSSFDAALHDAGVCNYNLIYLSSIIPPKSQLVDVNKYETKTHEYGDRLYVVKAEGQSNIQGQFIGAAIGYFQSKEGGGEGMFVEHHFTGNSKEEVYENLWHLVKNSMTDLCLIRGYKSEMYSDQIKMKECIVEVKNKPATVLVLAVYKSEVW
jgi:arginine decarboxylase